MPEVSYDSKYFKLNLKDGLLYVTYIGGPITLGIAQDLVQNRLKLTNSIAVPVLVNVIDVKGIDRDARDYLSSEDGLEGLKAGAIVTDSAFTKHMANFFMKISFKKSKMPARVFSNEKEAIGWLRKYED